MTVARRLPPLPLDDKKRPVTNLARLASDASFHWPWPYTNEQIAQITGYLPAPSAATMRSIILTARKSVIGRALSDSSSPKPNPAVEAAAFKSAIGHAREAAEHLSQETIEVLIASNPSASFMSHLSNLLDVLYSLEYLDLTPATLQKERKGAPEKSIGWVLHQLDIAFVQAHGGNRPSRGFPAFVEACIAPLGFEHVAPATRRDQLKDWRARRNWPNFS